MTLQNNKRGLSEVISYVLLIILALSVSVLLYSYFELYTPKERPSCPDGVSLALQEYACTLTPKKACPGTPQGGKGKIDISLSNNGKRSVSGAYLRIGASDRKVKEVLNKESPFFGFFPETGGTTLPPGGVIKKNYSLALQNEIAVGQQGLEIEPVIGTPGNLALCEKATVTRTIECALPTIPDDIFPKIIPGSYTLESQVEPGSARVSVLPDAAYSESINYLEATLYRWVNGKWEQQTRSSDPKVYCPDARGTYALTWGGLGGGSVSTDYREQYRMESIMVLHDGRRILIKYQGSTAFEFTIYGCKGECSDGGGATIYLFGDPSVIKCTYKDACLGNVAKRYFCQRSCYTEDSKLDAGIIYTDGYNCPQGCTVQYGIPQCTGTSNFLGSTTFSC